MDSHQTHHHAVFNDASFAETLETEAELASDITAEAVDRVRHQLAGGSTVRRIVDVGCGPGVAACSLAAAFPSARVVGVDGSTVMLERAARRAARLGVDDRLEWHAHDLDADLGELGSFDLAWMSLALHHAEDEHVTLTAIRALLLPDGLLCLLERAAPAAVRISSDLGRSDLWDRVSTASQAWNQRARHAHHDARDASAYRELIERTGFTVLDADTLTTTTMIADGDQAGHSEAARLVRGARRNLAAVLDDADLRALDDASTRLADYDSNLAGHLTYSRLLVIARATRARS